MSTIRRQLTWKLLAAFAVPLLITGVIADALIRDEITEQLDAALKAEAEAVAAVTEATPAGGYAVNASARVMREFDERDRTVQSGADNDEDAPSVFQVRRLDGSSVIRSASLRTKDLPSQIGSPGQPRFWDLTLPSGAAGRAVSFRFRPGSGEGVAARPEDLWIVAAVDRRDLDRAVNSIALLLAGCGAVLLAAAGLVVPRVIRREFAPIDALADAASRVTADSLGFRFSVGALPDELAPIGLRLNDLLTRLEASFDRERHFSADLAHELRTPLAELRTLAELAVKWPEARPADADRDVLAIATQMENVVARLLSMLRSEHGKMPLASERIDLGAFARQVWTPFDARAAAKSLQVTWDVPGESPVWTDPVLLRSIMANLMENAIDYSPAGGEITIELQTGGGRFELRMRNDADGLPADGVTKLFDRLWRGDAARSDADHAGLGLALARAFARALGGDLTAMQDVQSRLQMTLACPSGQPGSV